MTTPPELDRLVRELLSEIAPDTDPASLSVDDDIRDCLDIDSVDFLNFIEAVHARTGVDVPERDYPAMGTIGGAVGYLADRVDSTGVVR